MVKQEEFQRPTFDARIQYYELLRKLLEYSKQVGITGQLSEWYRSLHEVYNMVHAYIDPEQAILIKSQLDMVRNKIFLLERRRFQTNESRLQFRYRIDDALLRIDEHLHKSAKRMFLPLETNGRTFDIHRFTEESDLG